MKHALRTESLMKKLMDQKTDDRTFLEYYINMYLGLVPFKLNDEFPFLWDLGTSLQAILDKDVPLDDYDGIDYGLIHCYQKHPDTGFTLAETIGIKTESLFKLLMMTDNKHSKPFHEWVKRGGYERYKEKIQSNNFLRMPLFDYDLFLPLLDEAAERNESLFECLVNKAKRE